MNFPEWSDLGGVSTDLHLFWEEQAMRRQLYLNYFSGEVFRERVDDPELPPDQRPLLFPVGMNLVKMMAFAQADSLFGEWDDQILKFQIAEDATAKTSELAAIEYLHSVLHANNADAKFWELALDMQLYGGAALKISPTKPKPAFIRLDRVPQDGFYPIWDPEDPDELLEVYVVAEMTKEQALLKYGVEAQYDLCYRVEHWTREYYVNTVDGHRIDAFSGYNPWGLIPFVYIPRVRTTSFYGDSLAPEIIPVQDELNMRVADIGEWINYNAHPIKWGYNLPQAFTAQNYPVGPNVMWDLGRRIGQSEPPTVGILEAKNPIPEGGFSYVNFLYDFARTSSQTPPIAFGEDSSGAQRSGVTLEIRMWPLIKATRRSRSYFNGGMQRLIRIVAAILSQRKYREISSHVVSVLESGQVVPSYAEVMPRDQAAIVDEVVKLLGTDPPAISLETAQRRMGRGPGEVERIKAMIKDEDLQKPLPPAADGKAPGANPAAGERPAPASKSKGGDKTS